MNPQDPIVVPSPEPVKAQGLIEVGELFSSSWSFFKKNWKILTGIPAVIFICFIIVAGLFYVSIASQSIVLIILCVVLYVAIAIILGGSLYPALINAIHRLSTEPGCALSVLGQYKFGLKTLWSFILVMIISFLVAYGSMIFLIIPGIVIGVYIGFNLFTLVIDGKKGFSALTESYSLIVGRWWAVFGRVILFALVSVAALIVFEICLAIITGILGTFIPGPIVAFIPAILLFAFEICLVAFAMTYMYKLYSSLKSTRQVSAQIKSIKPWLVAFMIIGVFVFIGYIFLTINSFSQLRQSAYSNQMNNAQLQAQIQNQLQALQQNSAATSNVTK